MKQYIEACNDVINNGEWVYNSRTGKSCLTKIDVNFTYQPNKFPLITTKKTFWKSAIAEMLGYIRGYTSAADFRKIGTKTWDANANENKEWLNSDHRSSEDDMGIVYGAIGNNWPAPGTLKGKIDLLDEIYRDLKEGKDNRGEIWTFWNPGMFHLGCLRPCMYSHHFSILGGKLYLNSTQRSADMPLGAPFNMVQVYVLWALMAQITGLKMGQAFHKIVNAHFYEDQVDIYKETQMLREPHDSPILKINPKIKTLEDLRTWVTIDDFTVEGYTHHEAVKYPFSV